VSPEIFLEPTLHTSFKIIVSPVAPIKEQTAGLLRATKNVLLSIEKRLAFHLRVLHQGFRPRSIQAISIKSNFGYIVSIKFFVALSITPIGYSESCSAASFKT